MHGKNNMETYITICKIDSQWEMVGSGKEGQEGGDICTPMADSC